MLRSQLEQVAGQFNSAKSNVVSLTGALRDHRAAQDEAASGIKRVNAALEEIVSPIRAAVGGFGQIPEILGVAFAAEKLIEFAKEMGELGERTLNLAAAVGTTPEVFAELSAAIQIAGGTAETASRSLERLGHNISTALGNPTSEAAKAFNALGVTEEELKRASTDLEYSMRLLADKFVEFQDTPSKTAAFIAILGRGFENLIPYLRQGGEGIDEFKKKAEEVGGVLSGETIRALADTKEKMNLLGVASTGLAANLVSSLKPAIDGITSALTGMIASFNRALGLAGTSGQARLARLSDELADINRQIAEGSEAHTRPGAGRGLVTVPALPEGEARRMTHGPRFGQVDTSVNNLATLRARAAPPDLIRGSATARCARQLRAAGQRPRVGGFRVAHPRPRRPPQRRDNARNPAAKRRRSAINGSAPSLWSHASRE